MVVQRNTNIIVIHHYQYKYSSPCIAGIFSTNLIHKLIQKLIFVLGDEGEHLKSEASIVRLKGYKWMKLVGIFYTSLHIFWFIDLAYIAIDRPNIASLLLTIVEDICLS